MQSSLTFSSISALFGIMVVGAVIPSVSVFVVTARSAASGFIHGVFATLGIMLGDIFFILLAIFGLTVLAEAMGGLFVLIKYLGGAYLIWLGTGLWRSKSKALEVGEVTESSLLSSFLAGLFITLGDQKAILFYFGFFPAFVDLSTISYLDTGIILGMAIFAIGSAKLSYAYMASRARFFISSTAHRGINILAGSVMMAVGVFLIVKAGIS